MSGQNDDDELEEPNDFFINTKTGVLNSLDSPKYDAFNLDEIVRIFIQSVMIITAQNRSGFVLLNIQEISISKISTCNRYDLVKEDFNGMCIQQLMFLTMIWYS
jgi:hypothetical protein